MIGLSRYITETLNVNSIFESTLPKKYFNDSHTYTNNVLNTLIGGNGKITFQINNTDTKSVGRDELSKKTIDNLSKLKNDIDGKTSDDFDMCFTDDDYEMIFGTERGKKAPIFTKIVKDEVVKGQSTDSGARKAGDTLGEVLVCAIYNNSGASENDIDTMVNNIFSGFANEPKYVAGWKDSSILTSDEMMKKWKSDKYYAVQVDSDDVKYYTNEMNGKKTELMNICALFRDKLQMERLLSLKPNTLKSLYARRKDEWNKADILLIAKNLDYNKMIQAGKDIVVDTATYNEFIKDYLFRDEIIPISLKKCVGSAKITSVNVDGDEHDVEDIVDDNLILNISKIPSDADNLNGSIYLRLDGQSDKIQIFKRKSGNTSRVELLLKNSKGGSGLQSMLSTMGIDNKTYYNKLNEYLDGDDEKVGNHIIDVLQRYFKTTPDKNVTKNPGWCKKICFLTIVTLIELFSDYYKKAKRSTAKDDELGNIFFNFAFGHCNGEFGNGAFYIIK